MSTIGTPGGSTGSGAATGTGTGAGGGSPPTNAGGSPAAFQPPPGQRLVSDADWSARDGFYTEAQKHGFKDAATLAKYGGLHKHFTESGRDPEQFANLLGGKPQQQPAGGQPPVNEADRPMTRAEMDKWYAEREGRTKAEIEYDSHRKSYPEKVKSKVGEFMKSAGFKPEAKFSRALQSMIEQDILQARLAASESAEWQGSPLKGDRLPPPTDALIESVLSSNKYQDLLTEFRGEFLAAIGDGAGTVRPTAAGAGGQPGASNKQRENNPDDDDEGDLATAPGQPRVSREEQLRIVRSVQNGNARQTA